MENVAFVWSEEFLNYKFGDWHPFKPIRELKTKEILKELNILKLISIENEGEEILKLAHTEDYINFVKEASKRGNGFLDYGDTPATKGIYEASLARVSATIKAIKLVHNGNVNHAQNVGGGLHHAKESSAAGFCVFNDVAIGARYLTNELGYERVAIIDVDGHHADGTQSILYNDKRVLKISLHQYYPGFYPGTGDLYEYGEGEGEGYTLNVPLPPYTADDAYLYAFNEVVVPSLLRYKPQFIIVQFGGDSHYGDLLVDLQLSSHGYMEVLKKIHSIAHEISNGKLVLLGGGGYNYDATARTWALGYMELAGINSIPTNIHDETTTFTNNNIYNKVKETVSKIKEIHNID
jgi:acetoin utilization protein AcuC